MSDGVLGLLSRSLRLLNLLDLLSAPPTLLCCWCMRPRCCCA